ncbi:MAG: hypothetical protein U5L45_08890 [Saprospiraceae bacterium]|nr:hypothetical protein [Saprospiraceae bacterium]
MQKTLLGYAHPSVNTLDTTLASLARRGGNVIYFSAKPKNKLLSINYLRKQFFEKLNIYLESLKRYHKIYLKPYIKSKLLVLAFASLAQEGECGSFFGQSPKNEPPLLLLRERSERKSAF